jgi:signal transduction histidine kinase
VHVFSRAAGAMVELVVTDTGVGTTPKQLCELHVASRLAGDMAEVVVTDMGLGMTAERSASCSSLQPARRERSQQEGTGIGLVISQRLPS